MYNRLMVDISEISKIKSELKALDDKRGVLYKHDYEGAVKILKEFSDSKNPDKNKLRQAASMLISAIKSKKTEPEPYICISYIFFVLNNQKKAIHYLQMASALNSEHPQVIEMRRVLEKSNSVSRLQSDAIKTARKTGPLLLSDNSESVKPKQSVSAEKTIISKINRINRR